MSNGTGAEPNSNVINSCFDDANAQLVFLKEKIARKDPRDLAIIALAAENTIKTVRKLNRFNLDGIEHGMA